MENRTVRPAIPVDPDKKKPFEEICGTKDLARPQVARRLVRQCMVDNAGGRALPERLTSNAVRPD